jgi:hypothetical protein
LARRIEIEIPAECPFRENFEECSIVASLTRGMDCKDDDNWPENCPFNEGSITVYLSDAAEKLLENSP